MARGAALAAMIAVSTGAALPAQRPRAPSRRARAAATGCPTPRPATWAAVDDSAWPMLTHREGDQAWAHLEPDSLPSATGTWCNPLDGNAAALAAGANIYAAHCLSCHGVSGKGDGPLVGDRLPRPSDFSAPAFAGMRVAPGSGVLYAVVTRGIGGTPMRSFGELGPWERLAVLAYVTRFPGDSAIAAQQAWADTLRARRGRPR